MDSPKPPDIVDMDMLVDNDNLPLDLQENEALPPLKILMLRQLHPVTDNTLPNWETQCNSIINDYNTSTEADNYTLLGEYENTEFKVLGFYQQNRRIVKLPKKFGVEIIKNNVNVVLFYIYTCHSGIVRTFATTTGYAYKILKKHIDYAFPDSIAKRIANLNGVEELTQQDLLGNSRESTFSFKNPELVNPVNFGCITRCYTVQLRQTSSLYHIPCFLTPGGEPILGMRVEFTSNSVKINHKIGLSDYLSILKHFACISSGEDTFEYLPLTTLGPRNREINCDMYTQNIKKLPYTEGKGLDNALELKLWKLNFIDVLCSDNADLSGIEFCHYHTREWFAGDKFELFKNRTKIKTWLKPPQLKQVFQAIKESIENEQEKLLSKFHFQFHCSFRELESSAPNVLEYLQGMMIHEGKGYWRFRKMWYAIEDDYCGLVQGQFIKLLDECLLADSDKLALRECWVNKKTQEREKEQLNKEGKKLNKVEEKYNKQYEGKVGYIVGDQKYEYNLEVFDIMYYEPETKISAIYHVKKGFNNEVRDACSQIINSAKIITGSLLSGMDSSAFSTIYHGVSGKLFDDISTFQEALVKSTIIYAVVIGGIPNSHLCNERNRKWKVEECFLRERIRDLNERDEDFHKTFKKYKQELSTSIFKKMSEYKYISPRGIITARFLYCTKITFFENDETLTSAQKNAIYTKVVNIFKSNFTSMISKMEILRTRDELARVGFRGDRFKICQIPIALE